MNLPSWITASSLGAYSETHSFSVAPLLLQFTADAPAAVSLITGSLPSGLIWTQVGSAVEITGESTGVLMDTISQWTLRVTDRHGSVADRTFTLEIAALTLPPDWTGQPQFLGYVASSGQLETSVRAISPQGLVVTYSISAFAPPQGLSIDPLSGQLTYSAPSTVADATISFTLRAACGGAYSDLTCSITVLTVPHAPAWVTPQGLLAAVTTGEFLETVVSAFDSSGGEIVYSLVSAAPSWPFTLTDSGLIYGTAPTTYQLLTYQAVISATSSTGSTSQIFYIEVVPVTVSTVLRWSNPSADLGTSDDGAYAILDVSAVSSRGPVTHSITGGQLPLTMILLRGPGQIVGFVEYQLRSRSYLFDVTATDGVETVSRTYAVNLRKVTNAQFMGLQIPLEGSLKNLYYQFVGDSIQPPWYSDTTGTPQSVLINPRIQWISGLNYAVDDPAAALLSANLSLHTTELMIGPVTNVNVSATSTLFYAPILDQDAGADLQIAQPGGLVALTNDATVTIQSGTVQWGAVIAPDGYLLSPNRTSIVPGTQLEAVIPGTTSSMQGTVTDIGLGSITMAVAVTQGSGTSASWDFYPGAVYPPSLANVRRWLINDLGWTNGGQGTDAELLATIDPGPGSVASVTIIAAGQGFLYQPQLQVVGSGTGAELMAELSVVSTEIVTPGSGFVVGQQISLDQPGSSTAVLEVLSVNAQGGLLSLGILAAGSYQRWPAAPQIISSDAGAPARVLVSLGIGSVTVVAGGSGYAFDGTVITTIGSEPLPAWQSRWSPYLSIGQVQSSHAAQVYSAYAGTGPVAPTYADLTPTQSLIYYQRWPLQHAILQLQGINWTGDTVFDGGTTQWDGGATAFAEWTEPRDTLFDGGLELFDQGNTVFDDDYIAWQAAAQRNWGSTRFDQEFTIFDLYRTLFDDAQPSTTSITLLQRSLRILSQQISGHDVVV